MKKTDGLYSIEYLRDRFDYDPETGAITYRTGFKVGKSATYLHSLGYLKVSVKSQETGAVAFLSAGRVAWALYYGRHAPADMDIDHINNDRADNRLANLQCITHSENCARREARKRA